MGVTYYDCWYSVWALSQKRQADAFVEALEEGERRGLFWPMDRECGDDE